MGKKITETDFWSMPDKKLKKEQNVMESYQKISDFRDFCVMIKKTGRESE